MTSPCLRRLAALALALLAGSAAAHHEPGSSQDVASVRATVRGNVVRLDWTVSEGHYLFRDKLRFATESPGVDVSEPVLPAGRPIEDPFFGKVSVLDGRFSVELAYRERPDAPGRIRVEGFGSGCASDGTACFPEQAYPAEVEVGGGLLELSSGSGGGQAALGILKQLGEGLGDLGGGDEFLDPDDAFVLEVEAADARTVVARWRIAEGYYLYRAKFGFTAEQAEGVSLGDARFPAGKVKQDDYFGEMEVFYHDAVATVPLRREAGGPTELLLGVRYQGCADAGLCYPPIEKIVSLVIPAAGAATPVASAAPPPPAGADDAGASVDLPEQDRVAALLEGGVSMTTLALFFGFGLLLSFTPCVLPMIPILSSIIVGRGDDLTTRSAFGLSLIYVLAMALTYTAAGVIAGLSGANLQIAFQDPRVLVTFSAVFVALAFSMFGFYDLQVPAALQARLTAASNRQQGGTYLGVAVMGFLSALIVGPCVAAPLAGALMYIANTGDAVLGGLALFALSLGMGTPLLFIGTSAARLLPRAGAWMTTVKAVFGVLLLGLAIYLLERVLPDWIVLLMWAALLIVCAIYMGALDALPAGSSGWRRLWKGAGLVMVVYGVLLMVGAAGGSGNLFQPLKGLRAAGGARETGLTFKRVKGIDGLQVALEQAMAAGQPVMLDYYADWCVSCKEMERFTFSDPGVQAALASTVLLQADVTDNDEADQTLMKQHKLLGPPAILFFGPDGQERPRYRVIGFMKAAEFRRVVEGAVGRGGGAKLAARGLPVRQ